MFSSLAHLFTPKHTNNHRARIIHPEGFVILTAIALMFHVTFKYIVQPFSIGQVLGYASSITVSQVFELTNRERANNGLPTLTMNDKLTQAAVAKATNIFDEQYWAHNSPSGKTPWVFIQNAQYKYSIAGENLARDFGDTQSMVDAWIASPTHKANILQRRYQETGIAVVDGTLNGVETTLVVQLFGTPSVATAKIPSRATQTTAQHVAPEEVVTHSVLSEMQSVAQPMISPTDLTRAVFLAMVGLLLFVFVYDSLMARRKNLVRVVGKNAAHIMLFAIVLIILLLKQGGSLL